MLVLALILAACSVWLEVVINKKIPGLAKLSGKYMLVGIAVSLALSYLLGIMFGASGIIIMIAGLVSTAISEPIRRSYNMTVDAKKKVETVKYWTKETNETYKYALIAFKWIGIVLLSPLWVPVVLRAHYKKRQVSA